MQATHNKKNVEVLKKEKNFNIQLEFILIYQNLISIPVL